MVLEKAGWDWGDGTIKSYSGNETKLSESQENNAEDNWDDVVENADKNEYSIDLYYMDCGTKSWQALVLTNKDVQDPTIDIPVKKVWKDENNRDGLRPDSIRVRLYKNDKLTDQTVVLNESNGWEKTFKGLPEKDSSGNTIKYTVKETNKRIDDTSKDSNAKKAKDNGYVMTVSGSMAKGFTVTNTYNPKKISIKVDKSWDDDSDRDGIQPEEVKIKLKADGVVVRTATLKAPNWSYTFENLYKYRKRDKVVYAKGEEIVYTIEEDVPPGYSKNLSKPTVEIIEKDGVEVEKISRILTNTHEPELVKIPVRKIWNDDTDRDGLRPDQLEFTLYADDKPLDIEPTLVEKGENEWEFVFESTNTVKLYKYRDGGTPIEYRVEEKPIENAQPYDPNQKYEEPVVTPQGTVDGKNDAVETKNGVTKTKEFKFTNKHVPETIDIEVEKQWDDDDNRDNKRSEEVTFYLKYKKIDKNGNVVKENGQEVLLPAYHADANHTPVEKIVLKPNSDPNLNWKAKITNLFRYHEHGKQIQYVLEEDPVPGNHEVYDEYVFSSNPEYDETRGKAIVKLIGINKHDPELVEIPITKTWDDDTDRDGLRPDTIQLDLYADKGTEHEKLVQTAVIGIGMSKDENIWSYKFTSTDDAKIFKYRHNGILINYTVVERKITNSQSYNAEQKYDDPQYTTGKDTTVTASAGTLSGTTESAEVQTLDGFGIINRHFPERMKLKIVKKWNDQDDLDEHRPDSVTFRITANGEPLEKDADGNAIKDANGNPIKDGIITLTKPEKYADTWVYSIEIGNLHRYYNHGTEIDYKIEEVNVPLHYEAQAMTKSPTNTKSASSHVSTKDEEKEIYTSKVLVLTLTIENKQKPDPYYEGYRVIEGIVWSDGAAGKGNDINGIMDDGESRVEGVRVTLRAADGTHFHCGHNDKDRAHENCKDTSVLTDKDGKYRIIVNRDINYDVYKLAYSPSEFETRLQGAYVEFEYDGMKYTTVKNADSGANTSKAIEDESTRNKFDDQYDTITTNTTLNSWGQHSMKASTKNSITNLLNYSNVKENNYDLTNQDKDYVKYTNVPIRYCYKGEYYLHTCPVVQDNGEQGGAWLEPFESTKYLSDSGHPDHTSCSRNHVMTTRTVDVNVITNVNLGLFEREQPSVGVFTDINKVVVEMNNQQYTYLYGVRTTELDKVAKDNLKVKFQNKDTYTYRRPVNPADITYINQVKEAMDVYVTYDVTLANLSTTLKMGYDSIVVYFDDDYTLKEISRGNQNGNIENSHGYKELNISGLNISVDAQSESSDKVSITYQVGRDAIKKLLNEEATLNHAVEITSYSSKYGKDTLYAEQQTGGRTNKPYAGYDYESHPDNGQITINNEGRLDFKNPEYDTDIAPSFVLCKDEEKSLSGNVWEDTKDETNEEWKEFRIGNGKKDSNENDLANAKVELLTIDDAGNLQTAKLYYTDGSVARDAVTFSDADGNYKFGDDACGVVTDRYVIKFTYGEGIDGSVNSTIKEVPVNGRNYKSTIISSETELYNVFKGNGNEEWHLNLLKLQQNSEGGKVGYSVAVDDIETRTKIEHLQYSNFNNQVSMIAFSKPFKMQVEFDAQDKSEQITSIDKVSDGNYVVDGETGHGKDLNVFDFGIIERAREDIFAQKTIKYLKITLANGQVLTEGDPTDPNQNPSYMLAAGFRNDITNGDLARSARDKWLTIQMDPELMQGAQLDVKYAITVTNNSEKDYDYYHGDIYQLDGTVAEYDPSKVKTQFYYFGENEDGDRLIKGSVNYLVDYIDTDFDFKWENAEHWKEASFSASTGGIVKDGVIQLRAEGQQLISEKTATALGNGKYKPFVTTEFKEVEPGGGTKTEYAYATKVLSNIEDHNYENHMEILQLDAKMARTLKGSEDGTPILKQYKMGNYVPSSEGRTVSESIELEKAGLHEQDDDRVLITITPPTGLLENIMKYGLISLGGLAILAIGVIIIKKKVLKK